MQRSGQPPAKFAAFGSQARMPQLTRYNTAWLYTCLRLLTHAAVLQQLC